MVEKQETVVVEVQPIVVETPSYAVYAEIVQNTVGRPRANAVAACLDPRYPLPSYARVGIQPSFALATDNDVVRLQRFDFEVETDGDWQPTHHYFTLRVGAKELEMALSQASYPETVLARDILQGRLYPVTLNVTRSAGMAMARRARYVVSFQFPNAGSRGSPSLAPGEGIFLSIDVRPGAPPDSPTPRLILVNGAADTASALVLVEKSGTATSVIPSLNELELAAYCSVMHSIRQ